MDEDLAQKRKDLIQAYAINNGVTLAEAEAETDKLLNLSKKASSQNMTLKDLFDSMTTSRGTELDQNVDYTGKMQPYYGAEKDRRIELDDNLIQGRIDLKGAETADLKNILSQMEADSKRRNVRGMIKNILGGASLFF